MLPIASSALEYARKLIHPKGKVIAYVTSCYWAFHNAAERDRLTQLKQRRGFELLPRRQLVPVVWNDQVDEMWYLGNDFQVCTYEQDPIPKFRMNISTIPVVTPFYEITTESKMHFLWYGSAGCVHKGLDWLLDIFAKHSNLHLHVCGLVELEEDFFLMYSQELFHAPNIHFHGWVLPNTEKFQHIRKACTFVLSPSCAEGGGGATLQCMLSGLVPIATEANSVDISQIGFMIHAASIEATEKTILEASFTPIDELVFRSNLSRQFVEENHTLAHYRASIRARIITIFDELHMPRELQGVSDEQLLKIQKKNKPTAQLQLEQVRDELLLMIEQQNKILEEKIKQ